MHRHKRNKILHIVLLIGILLFSHVSSPLSAETEIVLGLVAGHNAIVKTQEQAESISDYLSEYLSAAVKISAFNDQATLHQWLVQHRLVHIAWFDDDYLAGLPVGEVLPLAKLKPLNEHALHGQVVARQGVDPVFLQEFQEVLLSMQENDAGMNLLEHLQGERFLPGSQWGRKQGNPLLVLSEMPSSPAADVSAESSLSVANVPTDPSSPPVVNDPAEYVSKTATTVYQDVTLDELDDSTERTSAVRNTPQAAGRSIRSQKSDNSQPQTNDLVVPVTQSHSNDISETSASSRADEQPVKKVARKRTPSSIASSVQADPEIVLGLVSGQNALVQSENQAKALSDYLSEHLQRTVKASLFNDQTTLHQWLVQYQVVHASWFDDDFLASLPVGEVLPLAALKPLEEHSLNGQLVVRQGMNPVLTQELQSVLLSMQKNAAGLNLLSLLQGERFLPGSQRERGQARPLQPLLAVKTASPVVKHPAERTPIRAEVASQEVPPAEIERQAETQEVQELPPAIEPSALPAKEATELSVGATETERQETSLAAPEEILEKLPVQEAPSQATEDFLDSLPMQKVDGSRQVAVGSEESGKHDLTELMGETELSVLSGIEGQFVQELVENRLMEDELVDRVDETTLSESIHAGRSFSRESFAALARTEQAKARTGQTFALLMPYMSISASSGQETSKPSVQTDEETGELVSSDTHTRTDASFVIRQPLFDLPRYLDWRRSEVIELARDEDYRASDGDAYLSTVNSYLSLVSSRLQTDVTRDFETQLTELLRYIEKRTSAGAASVSDMARVNARSEATLSVRLEQESAHAAAWIEFVRLTNLAPQKIRLPVPVDVGAALLPQSFDMAVATAMQYNPEIAVLTAELEAAKIDQSAAKGRYLPRIDAEYTYTYSLHAGGDPDSGGQKDERIMAVLNWDLFNGGRDYNYNIERSARYKELKYRLDDQRRRVIQELSENYATLTTTRERIEAGYQELESISTAAEAMSKRMLSGNQSLLDLLDVYDRLYRARARLVNLHVHEMNTVSQLVRLTLGTPWASSSRAFQENEEKRISSLSSGAISDQNRANRNN